jgi:hypothetical protein
MSVWDITIFIVITYLFVAYVVTLFSIIGDLFHDREVSGTAKAFWVVLFLVVPVISVVTYMIVRGDGMAERSLRRMQPAERARYLQQLAEQTSAAARVTDAPLQAQQIRGPRLR